MLKKHRDKNFYKYLDAPHNGKGEMASPVIILNDKGQVGLIIQDNMPTYRFFGNGFTRQDTEKFSRKGPYHDKTVKILKKETNLPIKLIEKIRPVVRFNGIGPSTAEKVEANRVFVLDIGSFPIESKKGAYVEFFDPDKIPYNMNTSHREITLLALKAMKGDSELQTAVPTPQHLVGPGNSRGWQLNHMIANGQEIHGLDRWLNDPKVLANPYSKTMRERLSQPAA